MEGEDGAVSGVCTIVGKMFARIVGELASWLAEAEVICFDSADRLGAVVDEAFAAAAFTEDADVDAAPYRDAVCEALSISVSSF